jgi:urease accessory protein
VTASLPLLAALQLGDSLLPTGAFTLSHGLASLANQRLVASSADLESWLQVTLRWQVAPSDGVAAAQACQWAASVDDLAALEQRLLAVKLAREPREASQRSGRQLLRLARSFAGEGLAPLARGVAAGRLVGLAPIVLGVTARCCGLDRRETVLLLLHQHVSTVLGAALRLLDLDHVEAQRLRFALGPTLARCAELSLEIPWEEIYACAPQTELMTMLHERSKLRLFAT